MRKITFLTEWRWWWRQTTMFDRWTNTAQHSLLIRLCLAIQMGKCRWLRSRLIIIICSFDLCEVTLLWHPTIDVAHLSPYAFFTLQAPRQNSTPDAEWGTQHLLLFVLSYLFALPLYLCIHRSVVGIAPLGRTVATNAECVHAATFLRILRKFWVFTRAPNEQLMSLRTARLDRFDGWFSGRWREMDNVFVISVAVSPIDRQILIRNIYSMTIFSVNELCTIIAMRRKDIPVAEFDFCLFVYFWGLWDLDSNRLNVKRY